MPGEPVTTSIGACDCCGGGAECGGVFFASADLEWTAAGDLDLWGALTPPIDRYTSIAPGDQYWDNFTATYEWYPDPRYTLNPDHDMNRATHWSSIASCGYDPTTAKTHQIRVVGPLPAGCEDGGLTTFAGTNPKNEHWLIECFVEPGQKKYVYGWYSQFNDGNPTITPTVKSLSIENFDLSPFGGQSCKLLINGTDELLPGDIWSTDLLSPGFGAKGDQAFAYVAGHIFHDVAIITVENGGPV